jgi:hypothetical protein
MLLVPGRFVTKIEILETSWPGNLFEIIIDDD